MNGFVVVAFCFAFVIAASAFPAENKYTTKYDNVDLDEILKSDRLLNNYIKCLLDQGKCTPDGAELKKTLPDAIENECKSCSEKQRGGSKKVIEYLIDNKPDSWKELEKRYDPDGSYRIKYEKTAKDAGININKKDGA